MPSFSPTASILIIGNEILSGRTTEANLQYIAKKLVDHGISLEEARVIPDKTSMIANAVKACSEGYDYVFTTGGIGPTHDDITAEAVAAAFDLPLEPHPLVVKLLEQYYGKEQLTPARLKMALFPRGAEIIENPSSAAPGFSIKNVFVFAGVPRIMQAMLDGFLPKIKPGPAFYSESISCFLPESRIAEALAKIQESDLSISLGSYPFFYQGKIGTTLVARGHDLDKVTHMKRDIISLIHTLGETPIDDLNNIRK